jgi:hypothetical protein
MKTYFTIKRIVFAKLKNYKVSYMAQKQYKMNII